MIEPVPDGGTIRIYSLHGSIRIETVLDITFGEDPPEAVPGRDAGLREGCVVGVPREREYFVVPAMVVLSE